MLNFTVPASDDRLVPRAALLVYGGNSNHYGETSAIATVHTVEMDNERPTIMAGRLATVADLQNLVTALGRSRRTVNAEWLETRVLARGSDALIWWSAPCKRAMFFQQSHYNSKTFDGQGVCPLPGLVWMAMRGDLYVYAVQGAARPTRDTQLYQAPFFNVWGRGKVCVGNAARPTEEKRSDLDAWEQVLFGSRFTHPNFTEADRLVQGIEPCAFWQEMVKKPKAVFPEKRLVQIPLRVGDLLALDVEDRLNKLPKPRGEF